MAANVKAIRLYDPKAWWGDASVLGKGTIQMGEGAVEAAKTIDVYNVQTVRKELGYLYDGQFVPVGDYRMILQNVPWNNSGRQEIGRTVSNYVPLQNKTFFDMTDQLKNWLQLEGIGMLGNDGEITFVQYQLGQYDVGNNPNETHRQWLLFGDDKSGGGFSVGEVNTRVVCANTYRLALNDIEPVPHTDDTAVYLRYIVAVYERALVQNREQQTLLNAFFTHKLGKGELNKGITAVLPNVSKGRNLRNLETIVKFDTKDLLDKDDLTVTDDADVQALVDKEVSRYRTDLSRNEERRDALTDAFFRFNDEYPYAADTVYAFFNAVTNVTTHGQNIEKSNGKQLFHNDPSGMSLMWNERAKLNERAWNYAKSLLK